MDKKNTMLLTVIAVATLLVAVVGATFAYFSVTGTQSATTNVSASAGKIGVVNVTKGSEKLKLQVTAQDMLPQVNNTNYYAINTDENGDTNDSKTGGYWSSTSKDMPIATIQLSGAEENDTVKCDVSVKVDLSGDMVKELKSGDLYLTLTGISSLAGVENIDLYSLKSQDDASTATKTYNSTKEGISLTKNNSATLSANVWLVNKKKDESEGLQNYLANKSITVTIETSVSNCETTSAAAAA